MPPRDAATRLPLLSRTRAPLVAIAAASGMQANLATPKTSADPVACLAEARRRLQHGVLRADHWDAPDDLALAAGLQWPGQPPLAVALNGPAAELRGDARAHLGAGVEATTRALLLAPEVLR